MRSRPRWMWSHWEGLRMWDNLQKQSAEIWTLIVRGREKKWWPRCHRSLGHWRPSTPKLWQGAGRKAGLWDFLWLFRKMKRNPSGTQLGLLPEPREAEICSEGMTESQIMEKRSPKEREERRAEVWDGPRPGCWRATYKRKTSVSNHLVGCLAACCTGQGIHPDQDSDNSSLLLREAMQDWKPERLRWFATLFGLPLWCLF